MITTLPIADETPVTIKVRGIDVLALKKLSLVSHALADKMGGSAGREQTCLAKTLDDVIRKIELSAAEGVSSKKLEETEGRG